MKNSLRINRAPMAKKNFTYSSWHDVTSTLSMTVSSPSAHRRSTMLKLVSVLVLILTVGVGDVWGETIYNEDFGSNTTSKTKAFSSSTDFSEETTWSIMTDGGWNQGRDASSPSDYSGASGNAYAQKSSSAGDLILVFGDLTDYTDVVLSFGYRNGAGGKVARTFAAYVSGDGGDTWTEIECNKSRKTQTWEKITYEVPAAKLTDFAVKFSNTSNNQSAVDDVILTGTAAASCSVNPTIGAASLNGTFNLSTVGVQCASITPGTSCSVASGDYGFIWYERDGTKKEIGGSGVTKVAVTTGAYSSGSFSKDLTGSFTLGTRYSVRAFATNGKPATAYSDTITFQPRSVTFNLNGHGSSTPTTQYVNNGGKATDPSYAESVTGYTFGGWYKEAGCSNSWTFGTDVVSGANKTLYAKWTAKTYTIDLDQDLTPTSAGTTSISVTYNANTNLTSAITKPTKTGWTFAGYYTAKNGGGTQIIDADGNVLASKAGYTDASKNWIGTSDVTLYAKWTCTVTWSVNGLTNVYSAHTLTYNGTSTKVASIPGPPSPASYCGDKFVGWTSVENYVHGTSNLFTNVAGSPELKTVGNTTFYAVFADYDE